MPRSIIISTPTADNPLTAPGICNGDLNFFPKSSFETEVATNRESFKPYEVADDCVRQCPDCVRNSVPESTGEAKVELGEGFQARHRSDKLHQLPRSLKHYGASRSHERQVERAEEQTLFGHDPCRHALQTDDQDNGRGPVGNVLSESESKSLRSTATCHSRDNPEVLRDFVVDFVGRNCFCAGRKLRFH